MKRVVVALGICVVLLSACRAPQGAGGPPARARASETARLAHDPLAIYASVQAGDGTVWAVGYDGEMGLLRWEGDGWKKSESAKEWPGSVVEMAASGRSPGVVYSVWGGRPQTSGMLTILHVWRHEAGQPSRKLASFDNPTVAADKTNGEAPRVSVDADDTLWLAFPGDRLVRLAADGGEPEVIALDKALFTAQGGGGVRKIGRLSYMPESADRGWLWSVRSAYRTSGNGVLSRPARVIDGKVTACPPITGLPERGDVTWVSVPREGRMVWALEGEGLWEIDPVTMSAQARPSPEGAQRILDWRVLDAGVEVALAYEKDGRTRPDQLAGEVWVRRDGVWRNAGFCGDNRGGGDRPRDWRWWDGAVLGANFYAGLLRIDSAEPDLNARNLGWREHITARQPKSLHVLRDGRLLVVGGSSLVAEPGALRARWNPAGAQTAWVLPEQPVRAADGRIWYLLAAGRGAPAVRHWDGEAWHDWPLPAERGWWSSDSLWVDERGRVAVFSEQLEKPAWERDEREPGGWRRWESGQALVAARAAEKQPAATLFPMSEGFRAAPVLAEGGRALVRLGSLWHLTGGKWTAHAHKQLGTAPFRYGFEADGTPWFYTNGNKRRLVAEGTWADAGRVNDYQSRMSRTNTPWPEWLKARLDEQAAGSAHIDDDGVWWVAQDGELWKGVDGEVVRVFSEQEPSPFRSGMSFYGVKSDSRGNRLFDSGGSVLLAALPGPEVKVRWFAEKDQPADRKLVVSGGEALKRHEWRLNGGAWTRGANDTLWLRELPRGPQVVELRGYNRRLDAGPVAKVEMRVDYDPAERVAALVERLSSPVYETRSDAAGRLARHGAEAERKLRSMLDAETDEARRWWLRATLQMIEDRDGGTMPRR